MVTNLKELLPDLSAEQTEKLSAYILAQVKDIVGDNGLIDPNDPAGREGAAWKYSAKAELRREILAAAQARFGAGEGKDNERS